jgi:hypothetical protein
MNTKKGKQVKMLIYMAVALAIVTTILGAKAIFTLIVGLLVISIPIAVYFLPTIVGRHKKNVKAIFVLNLLLGWTLIGWVLALVWAFTSDEYTVRLYRN